MRYRSLASRGQTRLLVVLAFLLITGMLATTSALAAPSFTFTVDTRARMTSLGRRT